jgi:demethylmenaquinone methyltransferase / 2-methoxy-6-polyprenyl-1,4-benzoquinol methylase
MDRTTHFGYERVDATEKSARVREVFDSVAGRYDLMNDLMSLGVHRLWKRFAVFATGVRKGARVLDLAAGTGDITRLLADRVGDTGVVYCTDINANMLGEGRRRLIDEGIVGNVQYVQCDAQGLPFPDSSIDAVTIAFGLRNVTDKARALRAITRVLKPGGQLSVLEFSTVRMAPLARLYDTYSFRVLPWLGAKVAGDSDSYQYLAESIRMHPDQDTLLAMMQDAGLEQCSYLNLSGGVVAMHRGYRI